MSTFPSISASDANELHNNPALILPLASKALQSSFVAPLQEERGEKALLHHAANDSEKRVRKQLQSNTLRGGTIKQPSAAYPLAALYPFTKASFTMILTFFRYKNLLAGAVLMLPLGLGPAAHSQTCLTSGDMDEATRSGLTAAGQRFFGMIAKGDSASLRQNAAPTLASDFSAIEATVKDHQPELAGAQGTLRPPFVLDAPGTAPIPHAEFLCGVWGKNGQTANSAGFYLDNLPPGKYGIVVVDAPSAKTPLTVALVLQQLGNEWKLGGLYIKSSQVVGHDSSWYISRAREYKTKGQLHNAWLYYRVAQSLISPLDFMSTAATDKLYDEFQNLQPADFPAGGKTVDLVAGPVPYKLIDVFPQAVGNDLDLIVRYQVSDLSNTNQTYQSNVAVMKALVAKYPEVKEAFAAVVARAVDPSGRDYGTLLAMKDIK